MFLYWIFPWRPNLRALIEYSSSARPTVQHGQAASTKQLCLEISSLATVPVSWSRGEEAAAAPLCAPLTWNSSSCLLIHPTLPLLPGLSPVKFQMCPWFPAMTPFFSLTIQRCLLNTNQVGHLAWGQTLAIQGSRENKAKGCCHYSTS